MSDKPKMIYDQTFTFPLAPDRCAYLRIKYPMPEEDFDLIMKTLELWKPMLTVKTETRLITIDEACDNPPGSFAQYVQEQEQVNQST